MLRIFGRTSSSNTQKVLWALHELGLRERCTFEPTSKRIGSGSELLCELSGHEPFGQSKAFLSACGPSATIPVLVDSAQGREDVCVWESNSIVRYLAQAYGPAPLFDGTPGGLAEASSWMDYALSGNDYTPCLGSTNHWLIDEVARTPCEHRDRARVKRYHEDFVILAARVSSHLVASGRPFLTRQGFSVADIAIGCELNRHVQCAIVAQRDGLIDAQLTSSHFRGVITSSSGTLLGEDTYMGRLLSRRAFREQVWLNEAKHTALAKTGHLQELQGAQLPHERVVAVMREGIIG